MPSIRLLESVSRLARAAWSSPLPSSDPRVCQDWKPRCTVPRGASPSDASAAWSVVPGSNTSWACTAAGSSASATAAAAKESIAARDAPGSGRSIALAPDEPVDEPQVAAHPGIRGDQRIALGSAGLRHRGHVGDHAQPFRRGRIRGGGRGGGLLHFGAGGDHDVVALHLERTGQLGVIVGNGQPVSRADQAAIDQGTLPRRRPGSVVDQDLGRGGGEVALVAEAATHAEDAFAAGEGIAGGAERGAQNECFQRAGHRRLLVRGWHQVQRESAVEVTVPAAASAVSASTSMVPPRLRRSTQATTRPGLGLARRGAARVLAPRPRAARITLTGNTCGTSWSLPPKPWTSRVVRSGTDAMPPSR